MRLDRLTSTLKELKNRLLIIDHGGSYGLTNLAVVKAEELFVCIDCGSCILQNVLGWLRIISTPKQKLWST